MLGNLSDGKIPETMTLDGVDKRGGKSEYAVIEQDYQWNHNLIQSDVKILDGHLVNGNKWTRGVVKKLQLKTSKKANSIFDARNTLTWRTWGPLCTDTVCIDASKMKDGDVAGLAALNGDTGFLSLRREGGSTYLIFSEENVALSDDTKAITKVDHKEIARVKIPASKLKNVRMVMNGDFNPGRDIATFSYSLDGKKWNAIGGDYKMRFDYRRLFMGSRYAFCYYSTKSCGGMVTVSLPK
jgi:hypothetical protein